MTVVAQASVEPPRIGVLSLQGDYREHRGVLERLGVDVVAVRRPDDLAGLAGIVIPGGESTVMDKLAHSFGLAEPLSRAIAAGLPAYGTCAGLIMLSRSILDGAEGQGSLGGLDIAVRRNAFGTQLDSFETALAVPAMGGHPFPAVFIRAPIVDSYGPDVSVLATLDDGRVVAVRQGSVLGTSFHPEMTDDPRFHSYFVDLVRERAFTA